MTAAEIVLKWCNDFVKQNGKDPSPYEIFCQLELAIDHEADCKAVESSKRSTEQQDYLDKCAIAAMQKFIEVHGNYFERIVNDSHDLAEKMLAERERRAKG